jgi:WD40 repeat protein
VDVQDALSLRKRLEAFHKAQSELAAAQRDKALGADERRAAARLKMMAARKATEVVVDASRPEPPIAVLRGHQLDVTCIAVSGGKPPFIASGSEDTTVRLWGPAKGGGYTERYRLPHGAVVRAVACTGSYAVAEGRNLLLTGTADGRATLFDLDRPTDKGRNLHDESRDRAHANAVTCVAFSPNGKVCATGGEDRSICLWDTASGRRLHREPAAHTATLTWLQFASDDKLVSVGRDKRLLVWTVEGGALKGRPGEHDRRSGEVAQLGVSPDGERVMFDEGRELRVHSLDGTLIEGAIQNGPGAVNFSNFALFAPDGKTVLTNGSAPGRLQLWRAPSRKARAAEMRQFVWSSALVTCAAFSPHREYPYAVTGTQDHNVLVWKLPETDEPDNLLLAQLTYVEAFLDSSLKRVPIHAELINPGWVIPGTNATMVVPPVGAR